MTNTEALKLLKEERYVTHPDIQMKRFLFMKDGKVYNNNCDPLISGEFDELFSNTWRRNAHFETNWSEVKLEGWDKVQFDCNQHFRFHDPMGRTIGYNHQMMMRWLKENYETPIKKKK